MTVCLKEQRPPFGPFQQNQYSQKCVKVLHTYRNISLDNKLTHPRVRTLVMTDVRGETWSAFHTPGRIKRIFFNAIAFQREIILKPTWSVRQVTARRTLDFKLNIGVCVTQIPCISRHNRFRPAVGDISYSYFIVIHRFIFFIITELS